ncbi:MAG TPA: diacylglycerol kinase family protein [Symbiobacteriaceae bacterium]|nr:diacylglycerol kinase family protein [Symbiobacteriaceae bacterium]
MKALFLINPKAGRGTALKTWRRIEPLVAGERQAEAVIPESAAATRKAAADAARAGYDRVVVVGGDGTLAAVAGELAMTETALAVVPAGTGNDFCRNSGISRRPEEALRVALGAHTQRIDLGQAAGGRCFLNAAGIGFDAEVAAAAGAFPDGLGGNLPYLLGAFATLSRYRPVEAEVNVDGQRYAGTMTMIAVANGRYYGGGMQIAPSARRDDGLVDVYIAEGMGPLQILGLLPRVYGGSHVKSPMVHVLRGQHVKIQVGAPVRAHLDGEPLLWETLSFTARPQALSVTMPPDGAAGEWAAPPAARGLRD